MRVIAKRSLKKFWERPGCADARGPLHSWYAEAIKAAWRSPQDIKDQYASASICGNNRVVFNIGGNKYRLVVEAQYQADIVWVSSSGRTRSTTASTWRPQMTIKPIRNDDDLRRAFRRLEKIFQAVEGTPQADERDVLVTLIEAYENKHYDFGPADPVEAIKFRMEQEGLTPRDLEPYIGQSGRVSEVLNRRRPLSLRMVKRLHDGLKIPYESLMAGVQ